MRKTGQLLLAFAVGITFSMLVLQRSNPLHAFTVVDSTLLITAGASYLVSLVLLGIDAIRGAR